MLNTTDKISVQLYGVFRRGVTGRQKLKKELKRFVRFVRKVASMWPRTKVDLSRMKDLFRTLVTDNPLYNMKFFVLFICFCAYIDLLNDNRMCLKYLKTLPDMLADIFDS